MFEFNSYLNTCGEKNVTETIYMRKEEFEDGVSAISVEAVALGSEKDKSNIVDPDFGVGIDIKLNVEFENLMGVWKSSTYWCKPYFAVNFKEMPDNIQSLLIKLADGNFAAFVPVVNKEYKTVFVGKSENEFIAKVYSSYDKLKTCNGLSFVYSVGNKPSELMEKCVKRALKLLGSGVRHRKERRYPELLEYLGWCSWDSMQIRVCEDGLIEKCEEFKEKNIPVKWAILDDMWAEVHNFYDKKYKDKHEMQIIIFSSMLSNFKADPKRFPNELKGCIEKINEYGIKVGMWHPINGYWRGYDPKGEGYAVLKDYLFETKSGGFVPHWKNDKAYKYFKTIHDYYRESGADFVKIDNQSAISSFYKNEAPIGVLAKEFHDAMEASVGEHFDNCLINCMCMASENMWSRPVSAIARCSGDFQPENKAWFATHILMCAYSSVLQGEFYWCDWDMWWTDDGQAAKNSLMRAISGGPIYISDEIGRSRRNPLLPLVTDDGKILRCDRPGVPTPDCMTEDPTKNGKALKLQNMAGEHGILAAINIDSEEKAVTATISAEDIEGFEADEFAVYEHFSKECKIMKKGESFDITLENADSYKLYIFAPVKDGFAVIGRTDKFISPKTVEYVCGDTIKLVEDGPYAYVKNGELILVD